jgi:hypothetical protein
MTNFSIEDFGEKALDQTTHELLCWFCYMDDTFVIWPHGPEKLEEFLYYLNSVHQNIQFTMENDRDDHLPFLGIDIYMRPEGPLGHKIYQKSTNTTLCLNCGSQHHRSSK